MREKLSVGIIGCGEITDKGSAPSLSEARNVKIGMVMDVNEWAAEDIGKKYGVPYTTNLEDLLSNQEIDFVYIATPHHLHAPITIEAAEAGKHVIVEKPIAADLNQADSMIAECRKNAVALSTCFPSRYAPQAEKAKDLVDEGQIGEIMGIRITNIGRKPDSYWEGGYTGRIKSDWRKYKDKSGGGILIMNSIHDIDCVRYVTGLEAKRVYSEYGTFLTQVEVEDFINVIIRYTNGAIGIIEASSCLERPPRGIRGTRIYGSEGQIIESHPLRILTKETNKWQEIELERKYNPRTRFFEEFAEAVLAKKVPPVSGEDGRKALEVIVAAYESSLRNVSIELPI